MGSSRNGKTRRPHYEKICWTRTGYKAAAIAARHPGPGALVNFCVSTVPRMSLSMQTQPFPLQAGGIVDVQLLSQILIQNSSTSYGSFRIVPVLSEVASRILSCIKEDFKAEESFVCRKVHAALKIYTQRTRVRLFFPFGFTVFSKK